jgi:hypothetical protein
MNITANYPSTTILNDHVGTSQFSGVTREYFFIAVLVSLWFRLSSEHSGRRSMSKVAFYGMPCENI